MKTRPLTDFMNPVLRNAKFAPDVSSDALTQQDAEMLVKIYAWQDADIWCNVKADCRERDWQTDALLQIYQMGQPWFYKKDHYLTAYRTENLLELGRDNKIRKIDLPDRLERLSSMLADSSATDRRQRFIADYGISRIDFNQGPVSGKKKMEYLCFAIALMDVTRDVMRDFRVKFAQTGEIDPKTRIQLLLIKHTLDAINEHVLDMPSELFEKLQNLSRENSKDQISIDALRSKFKTVFDEFIAHKKDVAEEKKKNLEKQHVPDEKQKPRKTGGGRPNFYY